MSKEKLFNIEDLERAWNDGFNKTHSEWKSFKVKIVMEKVTQTLQNGLDLILEDTKKSEYEKFKEDVKGCTGPK